jgi:hypothetical protein
MTLLEAVRMGDAEVLKKLAAAARDINEAFENGRTALIEAAMLGRVDLVVVLIQAGADPTLLDGDRETALLKAAVQGHYQVVHLLSACASEDERELARAFLRENRAPFDPDVYQGRPKQVPEWRRVAAGAAASLSSLFGDRRPQERLARVERSELNAKRRK